MNKSTKADKPLALEVKDLVKRYGDLVAVSHLNLAVYSGEIFGLLGPNGSGKTTTINCILSLLDYEQGEINILGEKMSPVNYDLKSRIGLVMQDIGVYEELTVEENIDYFCSLYISNKKQRKAMVEKALQFVELEDFRKFSPGKLSGGLKRRLNLACGIAHDPEIIFLDEPTVAVDAQSRNNILAGIKDLSKAGKTIIYTTHYMEEVEQICDRLTIMDQGKELATGSPEEIKALSKTGEVITLISYDLDEAVKQKISALPDLTELKYENGELTLYYSKGEEHLLQLMHLLAATNTDILNVNVSKPSLNDVFLEITGKELRDNA